MASLGFPPTRRLRRRGEFQRVFDGGRRIHGRYLTLIARPTDRPLTRLGVVASKKLGGAVARNRAKRLIREMFRQTDEKSVQGCDLVVIPRPIMLDAAFATIADDFRSAIRRLQRTNRS